MYWFWWDISWLHGPVRDHQNSVIKCICQPCERSKFRQRDKQAQHDGDSVFGIDCEPFACWKNADQPFNAVYLIFNNFALPRMHAYPWWKRSHFYFGGDGPNFKPAHSNDVILSMLAVGLVASCLYAAIDYFGASTVFLFYGAPWLWTNHWIRKLFLPGLESRCHWLIFWSILTLY